MPILGKGSSIGMKLVQILDCDNIHFVTANTPGSPTTLSDPILCQYSAPMCSVALANSLENTQSRRTQTKCLWSIHLAGCRFP